MTNNRLFYRLLPLAEGCHIDGDRAGTKHPWNCPRCKGLRPGVGPIDVQLDCLRIREGPINWTDTVGLARKDFLQPMGREIVERDLILGRVFNRKGELLDDWVTYHGRRKIVVRGCADPENENSQVLWWYCEVCRLLHYWANVNLHIFPPPSADAKIYTDLGEELIIPPHLFTKLEIPKNAKVAVERLEVLDEPLDRFGMLPLTAANDSECRICHFSKPGCNELDDIARRDIASDVDCIQRGSYRKIVWHFFPDAETGRVEVAADLLQTLENNGIGYVLHE